MTKDFVKTAILFLQYTSLHSSSDTDNGQWYMHESTQKCTQCYGRTPPVALWIERCMLSSTCS